MIPHDFNSPAKSEAMLRLERAFGRAANVALIAVGIVGLLVIAGIFLAGFTLPLVALIRGTH